MSQIYTNKGEFIAAIGKPQYSLLGIDPGAKKIGLAVLPFNTKFAMPYKVVTLYDLEYEICQINSDAVVIGIAAPHLPRYVEKVIGIVQKLGLKIFLMQEAYSSLEADELLKSLGIKRRQRNVLDDKVAACVILNNFYTCAN